ncbi:MAG: endolytic transglycosylase MltG [Lachnospiraceae bacterium]|nr:endolytic transglycosylase MltG [Lachnospiraceae bacterium]
MLKAVRTILIVLLNIIFYGLVVFGGLQLCHAGYSFAYDVLGETAAVLPPGEDKSFTITEDEDAFTVAENLANQNLIKSQYSFYLRMRLQEGRQSPMKPGTYTLNTSMTYEEILNIICPA